MPPQVDRPIFIIGCPRSGTGLLHQLVRLHPDLAWITPLTHWISGHDWQDALGPRPVRWAEQLLTSVPRSLRPPFVRGPFDGSLSGVDLAETAEGQSIWGRHLPPDRHVATEADVTPEAREYLHRVVEWHTRYANRPRFVSKTPRNLVRMRYLHEVFPDARFVHLIRDGRAVAPSILKRRLKDNGDPHTWWGIQPPGWQKQQSRPPIEQCAWTWQVCLRYVEQTSGAHVPASRIYTLRYETLTQEPESTLRALFAGVNCDPDAYDAPSFIYDQIRPPRATWRKRLSDAQLDALAMLDDTLTKYGYDPVHAET